MLYKLEINNKFKKYYGNEQFEVKEELLYAALTKDVANIEFERHIARPNASSVKLYKLSWLGYKLIKEYDRERATKYNDRVDINTLLRDADRRSARGL